MYANNTRDLEGLDQPDASLENTPQWTVCSAFERDLLITTAFLEHTDTPTTAQHLKQALERWDTEITHADLHTSLETLTTANLLETYTDHLQQILQPNQITLTLERPITPGDAERVYCELLSKCQEVSQ